MREFNSGAPFHADFGSFDILPDGNLAIVPTPYIHEPILPLRILSPTGELRLEFGNGLSRPNAVAVMTFEEPDTDGDGIPDSRDLCPGTSVGAVVDANGCSIEQLAPCDGPWRNHGEYVGAVSHHASEFRRDGLITEPQRAEIVSQAARSNCGK